MLENEFTEVTIGSNLKYYENLGYQIPKYKDSKGRYSVKRGTKINVKVSDIPHKTNVRIEVRCDYCGELYYPTIRDYYIGHKSINKDSCDKCKHIKTQEIYKEKYGTTSIKVRSEIEGFKLGRNSKDGVEVYNNFILRGYLPQFKPEDYINCKEKLPYICPIHKDKGILSITYDSFINKSSGCPYCANEKRNEYMRYPFEFVKQKFEEKNYTLISVDYHHVDEELLFICNFHPEEGIQKTTFWSVLNYENNCKICRYNMQSGEFHYNWQGGISLERDKIKHSKEYSEWRNAVFEKDNYTCQVCGKQGGKLNAHHINNFSEYPELRFEVDNGITICEEHHLQTYKYSFHNLYTQFNNTKEQLEEYIQRYKSGEFDELRKQVG